MLKGERGKWRYRKYGSQFHLLATYAKSSDKTTIAWQWSGWNTRTCKMLQVCRKVASPVCRLRCLM